MQQACSFEEGFSYRKNNFSFNANDRRALKLIGLLTVALLSLIGIPMGVAHAAPLLAIAAISLAVAAHRIVKAPILIVYVGSVIISLLTRTPPFLDRRKYFPNSAKLEDPAVVEQLKKDLAGMLARTNGGRDLIWMRDSFGAGNNARVGRVIPADESSEERGWHIYNVKLGNGVTEHAKRDFPGLVGLLSGMPEVKVCMFSVLDERTRIPMHVGYFKGLMRYMLAIKVPRHSDDVFLCVNGEMYRWKEGEGVLWDDSYPHSVENDSDEIRVVLFMDVLRPVGPFLRVCSDLIGNLVAGTKTIRDEVERTEVRGRITTDRA